MNYCVTYSYKVVTRNQGILTGNVTIYDITMDVRGHILALHDLSSEEVSLVSYRYYEKEVPKVLSRIAKASQHALESSVRFIGRSVVSIVRAISNIKTSHRKV